MAVLERKKDAAILQLMDYSKFYDRENLRDVLGEAYKNNVRGKLYRLMFKMNQENMIQVMTPVGLSEQEATGEGLGQGALDSPPLRSIFRDSDEEASYASLTLGPLLFVDDLFRIAENIEAARAGMIKMEQLAESKILDYNLTKTNYIVFGNKKKKEKIEKELESNPLKLYGSQINQSKCEKYLGWYIGRKPE